MEKPLSKHQNFDHLYKFKLCDKSKPVWRVLGWRWATTHHHSSSLWSSTGTINTNFTRYSIILSLWGVLWKMLGQNLPSAFGFGDRNWRPFTIRADKGDCSGLLSLTVWSLTSSVTWGRVAHLFEPQCCTNAHAPWSVFTLFLQTWTQLCTVKIHVGKQMIRHSCICHLTEANPCYVPAWG